MVPTGRAEGSTPSLSEPLILMMSLHRLSGTLQSTAYTSNYVKLKTELGA